MNNGRQKDYVIVKYEKSSPDQVTACLTKCLSNCEEISVL